MPRRLQEQSLEATVDAVYRSIWSYNDALESDDPGRWNVLDIHDDFVVVRRGRDMLRVPYSFDDNGIAVFGEPEEVEMELEPVAEAAVQTLRVGALLEAAKKDGWTWDVVVIQPGWSKNGRYYPRDVLAAAVENQLFEGVKVCVFPEIDLGHHRNALKKNWDRQIGWLEAVRVGESGEIRATLQFLHAPLADRLRAYMLEQWTQHKKDLGLSIDARGTVAEVDTPDGPRTVVLSLTEALSLDVVVHPAAGGQFTQLVAAMAAVPEEDQMDPQLKRLWDLLQARRPEALTGLDEKTVTLAQLTEQLTDDELSRALTEEEEAPTEEPPATDGLQEAAPSNDDVRRDLTKFRVDHLLEASKLPELARKKLRARFEGRIATEDQIREAISDERDYLAEMAPARVAGLGGTRDGAGLRVGAGKAEKLQAGFDRAFGLVPENADLADVAPLGLRRLYDEITMGHDSGVTGILSEQAESDMLQEAFTNATLPRVVLNTMHRRLLQDYRAIDYRERDLISVTQAADFKTREVIRLGGFGDIPTVDPEAADYAELAAFGDQYEQYSVGQKGAIVTITRKHIVNDDVGAFSRVSTKLGRASRRTFAKFVYGFFSSNPNMQDGNAWFSVAHANLGTTAFSAAQLDAARLAMYNQTEPDSAEKLGFAPHYLLLPIDLEKSAEDINQTDRVVGSANNDANRWYHKFGKENERIIVVPFFADANDWVVTADPSMVDIIEVAFLNGQEEPEMFIADAPTVGQMFVADKVQLKIRHEYGGAPVDHRGVWKAVVV